MLHPQDRADASRGVSPAAGQIVTRLPSKRVKENPSKGSRRVMRSSRSMPIATSSPSAIEAAASDRQWMPAQFRPKPKFTASLFNSPPTVSGGPL